MKFQISNTSIKVIAFLKLFLFSIWQIVSQPNFKLIFLIFQNAFFDRVDIIIIQMLHFFPANSNLPVTFYFYYILNIFSFFAQLNFAFFIFPLFLLDLNLWILLELFAHIGFFFNSFFLILFNVLINFSNPFFKFFNISSSLFHAFFRLFQKLTNIITIYNIYFFIYCIKLLRKV